MKTHHIIGFAALAGAIVLAPVTVNAAPGIDSDADRIFKAACQYLADAKGFCVRVEVWKDVVLPTGLKVQTTQALEVQERRPDQLHIEVRGPRVSQGFWYQHKSLTILDRAVNVYGIMEVPAKIDDAIDAVEDRFGVEIPLGDVLVMDPYRNVMDHVETAEDLGKVTLLGVVCNHLAFTGPKADAQLWVVDGPKPVPRKLVINFKTLPGSPQITELFSDWDLSSPISESVFTFVPPDGAGKITVNPKKPELSVQDQAADDPASGAQPTPHSSEK